MEKNKFIKNNVIKFADEIIIDSKDGYIVNPSLSLILEDGWVIYQEPTLEKTLSKAKRDKIKDIMMYDNSQNINEFTYNGYKLWLNREERLLIKDRFEREIKNNVETSHIYYQGQEIIINPTEGLKLINDICDYADASFDVTLKHIYNVNNLKTVEEVINYEYKSNYPQKLMLLS